MKVIDVEKLIIKAKKRNGGDLKFSFGLIVPSEIEPGKWIAKGELWNGVVARKQGHRLECATCLCDSIDDAVKALNQLAEKYPNNEDVTVIVDTIGVDVTDEYEMFEVVANTANDIELNMIVDHVLSSASTGKTEEFNSYMQGLIKRYRVQILETVGFDSVDFSKLSVEQIHVIVESIIDAGVIEWQEERT